MLKDMGMCDRTLDQYHRDCLDKGIQPDWNKVVEYSQQRILEIEDEIFKSRIHDHNISEFNMIIELAKKRLNKPMVDAAATMMAPSKGKKKKAKKKASRASQSK